jgi:hypothetical protein
MSHGDWYQTLMGDLLAAGHVPLGVLMFLVPIALLERKSP